MIIVLLRCNLIEVIFMPFPYLYQVEYNSRHAK